jgi:hypothetical protein
MKFILLFLALSSQTVFSQVRHGTTTEEVIASGFYDWSYLNQADVGLCGLPMVTRGDQYDYLVNHHLTVETFDHVAETTERISLRTADQFESSSCISHKQEILENLIEQGGQTPITLFYTDKLITNRGSYMGISYCQEAQYRTIKATVNKVSYFRTTKISEQSCK